MDKLTKSDSITSDTSVKEVKNIILQLEAIVEESHDAIIGKTIDGTIVTWNGGATKMFGYTRDEMVGKSIADLFISKNRDELPGLLERIKKGETIADYDSIWIKKDGTNADVEFSISPIHSGEAGLIIGSSLVGRDVSNRKKSDNEMKAAAEKFKTYMQKAPIGIFVTDDVGNYTDVNEMACTMSGYSKEELLKISVKDFIAPDYLEEGLKIFNKVKTTDYTSSEIMVRRKNGEIFWINLVSTAINEGKNFIAFCEDISKRVESEKQLKEKYEEMEKFYKLTIGRELNMVDLKNKIKELEAKLTDKV